MACLISLHPARVLSITINDLLKNEVLSFKDKPCVFRPLSLCKGD